MINDLFVPIPVYPTSTFNDLDRQQRFRSLCKNTYRSMRTPKWAYPAFVFKRDFVVDAIDSIKCVTVSDGSVSSEIFSGGLVDEYQIGDDIYVAFNSTVAVPNLNCGEQYYYRIQAGSNLFYSETFEAIDISGATPPDGFIFLDIDPSCTINGIPYGRLDGIQHWLYLDCVLREPVYEEEVEKEIDGDGVETIIASRVVKKYQGTVYRCGPAQLDFLRVMSLYVINSSVNVTLPNNSDTYTVLDFSVVEEDYSIDDCAPSVTFNIQIESSANAACCDDYAACDVDAPIAPTLADTGGGIEVKYTGYPTDQWARIEYKLQSEPTIWTDLGTNLFTTDLTTGVTLAVAVGDYDVRIIAHNHNCSATGATGQITNT